jgi:REP element-mobilizing transposase RayT
MSDKYKIYDQDIAYFVTLTVVDWVDVFSRKSHKLTIVESLKFCQERKGLELYGWCLMSNHLHLIAKATGKYTLSEILRDFKKFTSRKIVEDILNEPESRRRWMIQRFDYNGKYLKRIRNYKFWQDGSHPVGIFTEKTFWRVMDYIHNNPVKQMIVSQPEDYFFSSARNYAGLENLLDIVVETQKVRVIRHASGDARKKRM